MNRPLPGIRRFLRPPSFLSAMLVGSSAVDGAPLWSYARQPMAELTRISISLESALLEAFDRSNAHRGYPTRSEAIRDLIREYLIRQEAKEETGEQVAVLTLVYDHHARELAARLIDKQHHHHELVVSSLHVHLGERHCLEVSVLRGPAAQVRHLGDELLSTKGVLHGEITFTSGEGAFNQWR